MGKSLGERIKSRMKIGEFRLVTDVCRSFRASRSDVENCTYDTDGLDLIVGRATTYGSCGIPKSEWEIERYE